MDFASEPAVHRHLGVTVDMLRCRAWHEGEEVSLTLTELRLLDILLGSPGTAFSRDSITRRLRGGFVMDLKMVDHYVSSLRRKMPALRVLIEAVRRKGYRFRRELP